MKQMNKENEQMETLEKRTPQMPPKERWGEAVPANGTHCSNCHYLKDPKKMICGEPNFILWNGGNKIPAKDPDKYCSIWWAPKEK